MEEQRDDEEEGEAGERERETEGEEGATQSVDSACV